MSDPAGLVVRRDAAQAALEPDPLKNGDVYGWAIEQAALIRAGRYREVDWINVADEIDSVGKSEFRSLSSHLEIVLTHMLKWDHQPSRRSRSWMNSIKEHRKRVTRDVAGNPSLPRTGEAVEEAYELARLVAARLVAERETGLQVEVFPETCPYDWDAIMTRPFVLDQTDETA